MGTWSPWLHNVAFILSTLLTFVTAEVSICDAYTSEQGVFRPSFGCYVELYCCGNMTYKHCCNDCTLALNDAACASGAWNPTHTIIQCVVLFIAFVLVGVIGILGFNGALDPKPVRSTNADWPQSLHIDPVKGYPVQPPINYQPGDNDVYPVQPGFVYQGQGQTQDSTESDTLIVPEIIASASSLTEAKLAQLPVENGGAEILKDNDVEEVPDSEATVDGTLPPVVVSVRPVVTTNHQLAEERV